MEFEIDAADCLKIENFELSELLTQVCKASELGE